ncbi:hypothetical protein Ancab_035432, partial [Ancistrocladus abbreviatus]
MICLSVPVPNPCEKYDGMTMKNYMHALDIRAAGSIVVPTPIRRPGTANCSSFCPAYKETILEYIGGASDFATLIFHNNSRPDLNVLVYFQNTMQKSGFHVLQDPVKMEAREGNSSDIRRPETEVGSANASNTSNFIEDFNDVPSNQGDFDHSAIDPSVRPSKKVRSKVWDHLIKICAENLKDQRAKCKYCGAILGADPAKELEDMEA